MTTFKTLSEFKKHLKVGVKLNTIFHKEFSHRDFDLKPFYKDKIYPIREVSIVQTNSFALKTIKTDGTIADSWCAYPKASNCIIKNNTLEIYETDREINSLVLTYSFAE